MLPNAVAKAQKAKAVVKAARVNNVYDIYNNQYDDKCLDFLFQKYYLFQLRSNNELTKILYEMNDSEFEIYKHENLLKDRI